MKEVTVIVIVIHHHLRNKNPLNQRKRKEKVGNKSTKDCQKWSENIR